MINTSFLNKKLHYSLAFAVFLFSLIIYILTLGRTLAFWDCGEFITVCSNLSVAHAPGTPFYVLLGRFFIILFEFIFSHAQIINFYSALLSSFAVLLTYLFTVQLVSTVFIEKDKIYLNYICGIIAAFFTAFSFSFWNNAIEAEVYAGMSFYTNLIIWLTFIWVEKSKNFSHQNILLLILYIYFISFSHHQLGLQTAPAILFIVCFPMIKNSIKDKSFAKKATIASLVTIGSYFIFNYSFGIGKLAFVIASAILLYISLKNKISNFIWITGIILIIIGFSPHLYLMIRANDIPYINQCNPSNIKTFMDYLLRKQFVGENYSFLNRTASFYIQITKHFLRYFSWQFFNSSIIANWFGISKSFISLLANFIVLSLGFVGAVFHYKKNKTSFAYLASLFIMSSFVIVFIFNMAEDQVRERDYFFCIAYNLWTIWMAFALVYIFKLFSHAKTLKYTLLVVIFILPTLNLVSQYHFHDKSRNFIPLDYGMNYLNSLEENAILFTNGDNDTFSPWYVLAVADPYSKENIYPAREIKYDKQTQEREKKAIQSKSKECAGIRKDVSIVNLSLLNTEWYIKHIKDKEGVILNISDREIDMLRPFYLPGDKPVRIYNDKGEIVLLATLKKDVPIYVSDLMVIQIIKDNFGKRPIYFAMTTPTNHIFGEYFRLEGLVYRLSKTKYPIDFERYLKNINEVYSYRSIKDPTIYKDETIERVITNYGSIFYKGHAYFAQIGEWDIAINLLGQAIDFFNDEYTKKELRDQMEQLKRYKNNAQK